MESQSNSKKNTIERKNTSRDSFPSNRAKSPTKLSSQKKRKEKQFIPDEDLGYSKRYISKLTNSNPIKQVKITANKIIKQKREERKFSISDIPSAEIVEKYIGDKRRAFLVVANSEY
jgi:hypothetical protein